MNRRGSVLIYGMMLGVVVIILALALAPSLSYFAGSAMNATVGDTVGLDCNNTSISNFDKATCTVVDINTFWFVGSLILIGGGFFLIKIIF